MARDPLCQGGHYAGVYVEQVIARHARLAGDPWLPIMVVGFICKGEGLSKERGPGDVTGGVA